MTLRSVTKTTKTAFPVDFKGEGRELPQYPLDDPSEGALVEFPSYSLTESYPQPECDSTTKCSNLIAIFDDGSGQFMA